MTIKVSTDNNFTLIESVSERLDAAQSIQFKEDVKEAIQQSDKSVILDLSALKFMDSTGLGVLVSTLKILKGERDLVIFGIKGMVLELFKLTRMDRIFIIADSLEDALSKIHL